MRHTLKIVTAYDPPFAACGDIAARSIRLYAAWHGHDHAILPMPETGRPPAWGKVRLLLDLLRDGSHDFIMWVDADACFVRPEPDILDHVEEGKNLYLVKHEVPAAVNAAQGMNFTLDRPNTGVMLIRRSPWSIELFERIWQADNFLNHVWWENAALLSLLGYRMELTEGRKMNSLDEALMARIAWLPLEWNSVPRFGGKPVPTAADPVIVHFAGDSERAARMSALRFRAKLGNLSI